MKKILSSILLLIASIAMQAQCFRFTVTPLRTMTQNKYVNEHLIDGGNIELMFDTLNTASHLSFQIGLNTYFNRLGKMEVADIPLDTPQTGNANTIIRNSLGGINLFFRFSKAMPGNFPIVPYADIMAGYRYTGSKLVIKPDQVMDGYEPVTRMNVGNASGINFGMGTGLLFMFGENVGIDLGMRWTYSKVPGSIVDLSTMKKEGNFLEFCSVRSPYSIISFKAGITININGCEHCDEHGHYASYDAYISNKQTDSTTSNSKTTETTNTYPETNSSENTNNSSSGSSGCSLFSIFSSGDSGSSSNTSTTTSSGNGSTNTEPKKNNIQIKNCCGDPK